MFSSFVYVRKEEKCGMARFVAKNSKFRLVARGGTSQFAGLLTPFCIKCPHKAGIRMILKLTESIAVCHGAL